MNFLEPTVFACHSSTHAEIPSLSPGKKKKESTELQVSENDIIVETIFQRYQMLAEGNT